MVVDKDAFFGMGSNPAHAATRDFKVMVEEHFIVFGVAVFVTNVH